MNLLKSKGSRMKFTWLVLAVAALAVASTASANTIAVTEFMNRSAFNANDGEFIELFNYGGSTVDLEGYQVIDNSLDSSNPRPDRIARFPAGISIAPGEYIILARNLGPFAEAFPGVVEQIQAYSWASTDVADTVTGGLATDGRFGLSDSSDEVIVMDPSDNIIWRAAFSAGSTGDSFYLADSNNFAVTMYGAQSDFQNAGNAVTPAIVAPGNDTGTGVLGYELASSGDPNAYTTAGGDTASPGNVVPIPEPASLVLLSVGALATLFRRR